MTPNLLSAPLLTSWLAVATIVSLVIAVGAVAAQQLAARSVPARFIWAAALLGALTVTLTQPARRAAPVTLVAGTRLSTTLRITPVNEPTAMERALTAVRVVPGATVDRIANMVATQTQRLPAVARRALLLAWPLTSVSMLLVLLVSYRRHRGLLARAERRVLRTTTVHITETTGPVVIGAITPAIVLPRSLLTRSDEEQDLVVAHEQAHIVAHDPLLLLAGCVAVVLMPWNAAAWFMLARLRLAIELDCDARVLARGASTRRYGQLLIELSADSPAPAVPFGAPAFSYRASHLERRLRTMTARPTRFLAARRLSAVAVAAAALLAACGAELPTAAELQGMDVANVETRLGTLVRRDSVNTVYVVNGRPVAAMVARAIGADSIATIDVRKVGPRANEIRIQTKGAPLSASAGGVDVANVTGQSGPVVLVGVPSTPRATGLRMAPSSTPGAQPLFLINGRKSTKAELDKLDPKTIERVEVLKGPSAVAAYGPDAANGAVQITLKK